jgi:hypothetical protein
MTKAQPKRVLARRHKVEERRNFWEVYIYSTDEWRFRMQQLKDESDQDRHPLLQKASSYPCASAHLISRCRLGQNRSIIIYVVKQSVREHVPYGEAHPFFSSRVPEGPGQSAAWSHAMCGSPIFVEECDEVLVHVKRLEPRRLDNPR